MVVAYVVLLLERLIAPAKETRWLQLLHCVCPFLRAG